MFKEIYHRILNFVKDSNLDSHMIDYIEEVRGFYSSIDNLLVEGKSLDTDTYKKKMDQLDTIFYSMCKEENIPETLKELEPDEKDKFMLTLVKSHKLLTEYDYSDTEKKGQREKVLEDLDLETIVFERHEAINLYHYLGPLLVSKARHADSLKDRGSAIKANEKLLYLYSNLERTPEVLKRAGHAASHLARLYMDEDPEKSEFYSMYELEIFTKLKGHIAEKERLKHIVYAEYRRGTLSWPDNKNKASICFNHALDAIGKMGESSDPNINDISLRSHEKLGNYHRKKSVHRAVFHYGEAIKLLENVSEISDEQLLILAKCHSNLGGIYYNKGNPVESTDMDMAIKHKESAVSIMKDIEDIDENFRNCWMMGDYMSIANISHKRGDTKKNRIYTIKAKEAGDTLFSEGSGFNETYGCYKNSLWNYLLATHRLGLAEDNKRAEKLIEIHKEKHLEM